MEKVSCLKCRGQLLPVDRIVDLGHSSSDLGHKIGFGVSLDDYSRLTRHYGLQRIWKCIDCGHTVEA